jgi:hypothetical protein
MIIRFANYLDSVYKNFPHCGMFFKSKIEIADFVRLLVRDHQAIFGRDKLDEICKELEVHFRDEPSYIGGFFELQAYGLYSITFGVKSQCGHELRAAILTTLNECFANISGANWEMMRLRVAEYEEEGKSGLTGALAARLVFDHPTGTIEPKSMKATFLIQAMDGSCIDALEAAKRLFKQYKPI